MTDEEIDRIAIYVGLLYGLEPKKIRYVITECVLRRARLSSFMTNFICVEDNELFNECCSKTGRSINCDPRNVEIYVEFVTYLFTEVRKSRRRHNYRLRKLKND